MCLCRQLRLKNKQRTVSMQLQTEMDVFILFATFDVLRELIVLLDLGHAQSSLFTAMEMSGSKPPATNRVPRTRSFSVSGDQTRDTLDKTRKSRFLFIWACEFKLSDSV